MENMSVEARISRLEQANIKLDKELFAAKWVASVLGAGVILGGAWTTNIAARLNESQNKATEIQKRMTLIETDMAGWEVSVSGHKEELKILVKEGGDALSGKVEELLKDAKFTIDDTAKRHKNELIEMKLDDILHRFQDGSLNLLLGGLKVINAKGSAVIDFGADSGGDGYFHLNSDSGARRYAAYLTNDNAVSEYRNSSGNVVMYVGSSTDEGVALVKMFTYDGAMKVAQLDGFDSQGRFFLYSPQKKGKYTVGFLDGRPVENFFNEFGKHVMSHSVAQDNTGKIFIYHPDQNKPSLAIGADNNGGHTFYYTEQGKQLVYIGPASNKGVGFVKVNSRFGDSVNQLVPIQE